MKTVSQTITKTSITGFYFSNNMFFNGGYSPKLDICVITVAPQSLEESKNNPLTDSSVTEIKCHMYYSLMPLA
jgi:hypothetical protein